VRDFGARTNDATDDQAYVVNSAGTMYGIDLGITGTAAPLWSANVGAMSAYPFPAGAGFIASLKNAHQVTYYGVNGTTVAPYWTASVPGPSGIRVDYVRQKIFVGSSDGNLYQIDVNSGAVDRRIPLSVGAATQVWTPTIDTTTNRLHVGTADGRVCAFQLPFP
jgi:outer membrane protein assembly factor BamB